jgi:outer membrane biosynthesis protein TonB
MSDDEGLRNSLVISTCLHVAALLFLYFGLPTLFKPLPSVQRFIPIDIVEIGDITNTNIGKAPEEAAKPAPAPPQPKPVPQPKEEVKPPEPPKPAASAETKPVETPDEVALPSKKPKPPPEPPKSKPQIQQDQLASVLKNVAKLKPAAPKNENTDAANAKPEGTGKTGAESNGQGPVLSDRLTISAEDALRRQISQCWNIPAGARNAESLIVEVLIEVNPDRTVKEAHVVEQMRMATDPYFRAAAESALRALRNPKCSPLELPADKYEQWKNIDFTFDPRDML